MIQSVAMRNRALFLSVLAALALTGCATLEHKFENGTSADIGFFTDTTVKMMREVNFGFTRNGVLYTKSFLDPEGTEEIEFQESTADADRVLKAIVKYSMRLVTIAETGGDEKEQIKAYADYLDVVDVEIINQLQMDQATYKAVVNNVRSQTELLAALRAAQPLINAVGLYMQATLDRVTDANNALNEKLDSKILAHYSDIIRYQNTLQLEKSNTLAALENIYLTVQNEKDQTAYKALLASGQIRDSKLIPKGRPTYDQLIAMSQYLTHQFDNQHTFSREIEPEWNQFMETQQERERLHDAVDAQVKQFLLVTLTWVRAHEKMASGKMKPAEWFDINEAINAAPGKLLNAGFKAIAL